MTDFQVTQIVIVITGLLTVVVPLYREQRNRRWDLEDRERTARDLAVKTQAAADLVRSEVVAAQNLVSRQTEILSTKIADNTDLTAQAKDAAHQAYQEANHVNLKIAALQQDIVAISTRKADLDAADTADQVLKDIEENTAATAKGVAKLKK